MIGVIDRDQRIDACLACGLQFGALKLLLVGGKHVETCALQADGGLFQLDEFNAGDGLQNRGRGVDDARHARMLMQRNPPRNGFATNSVISKGRDPRCRSMAGSVVSVNWTWQLGHHDSTWPDLLCDIFSIEFVPMRPDISTSPLRSCMTPQQ